MPISDFLIRKILNQIRSLNQYNEDDIDMMRYSLQSILWEIEKVIIIFLVFFLFGYQNYFLLTLIVLMSIRVLAGGYHSKTSLSCLLITFLGFFLAIIILPWIPLNNLAIMVLSIFSLIVTLLAAPIRSIEKDAIQSKDRDSQKKITAFIITSIWLILIFFNKTNIYAFSALWIIVLQNAQLLFEYLRRREDKNVKETFWTNKTIRKIIKNGSRDSS